MITYEAESATLKMTDKTHKKISAEYDYVVGRMRFAHTLNWFFDKVARLLSLSNGKTFKGGEYYVKVYGSGCGYTRSCKFKKTDIVLDAYVKKTANGKFSVSFAEFDRAELLAGEYYADRVTTSGALTRAMHVARFIGQRDYENPCYIKDVPSVPYSENKRASKRIWDRFCDSIFDFSIL